MNLATALFAGLMLGTGLVLSGMVNPAVVLGFLDVFGDWNPALALVMIAALAVALPGYRLLRGRKPLFANEQQVPARRELDAPLIAGAVIFGIGWGLAGICPGPAVTMLGIRPGTAVAFIAAMAAGIVLQRLFQRARS